MITSEKINNLKINRMKWTWPLLGILATVLYWLFRNTVWGIPEYYLCLSLDLVSSSDKIYPIIVYPMILLQIFCSAYLMHLMRKDMFSENSFIRHFLAQDSFTKKYFGMCGIVMILLGLFLTATKFVDGLLTSGLLPLIGIIIIGILEYIDKKRNNINLHISELSPIFIPFFGVIVGSSIIAGSHALLFSILTSALIYKLIPKLINFFTPIFYYLVFTPLKFTAFIIIGILIDLSVLLLTITEFIFQEMLFPQKDVKTITNTTKLHISNGDQISQLETKPEKIFLISVIKKNNQ